MPPTPSDNVSSPSSSSSKASSSSSSSSSSSTSSPGPRSGPGGRQAAPPPACNTGGNLTSAVLLDWSRLGFPAEHVLTVAAALVGHLGSYETIDQGLWGFHQSILWRDHKARITWSEGRDLAILELPGTACGKLGPAELLDLMRFVASLGGYATRLDPAFDDFDRQAPLDLVHTAATERRVLGFKRYDPRRPRNCITGDLEGDSAYFGRRGKNGSGKFVRIYDKALESGGQVDCIRWEVEHTGDCADLLFRDLVACQDVEQFTRVLAAAIGGAIDFVETRAGAHGHLDRMVRASWWERIRGELGACRYRALRVKAKLQQVAEWVERGVASSLAKLKVGVDHLTGQGRAFILGIVERAVASIDVGEIRGRARAELSPAYVASIINRQATRRPQAQRAGVSPSPFGSVHSMSV